MKKLLSISLSLGISGKGGARLSSMALMKISPWCLVVVSKMFDFRLTVAPCHPPPLSLYYLLLICPLKLVK
jgi:hypothetical protein